MKLGYIVKDSKKIDFLKDTFFDKYEISRLSTQSINDLDLFLDTSIKTLKYNDFVIIDSDFFNNDTTQIISKVRSFQRLYDFKIIILFNELDENQISEFKINDFYNLAITGNLQIIQDILDGIVDNEYMYDKTSDEEKIQQDFVVLKKEIVNIQFFCMSPNIEYMSFLTAINFANYLDTFGKNVYYQARCEIEHLYPLYEKDILLGEENYFISPNKNSNIHYCNEAFPNKTAYDSVGFYIYDSGYVNPPNDVLQMDLRILVCDSNIENIRRINEMNVIENMHVFIVDALKEQKDYINSLNIPNMHYIKSINSLYSLSNFEIFKDILKDNLLIDFVV